MTSPQDPFAAPHEPAAGQGAESTGAHGHPVSSPPGSTAWGAPAGYGAAQPQQNRSKALAVVALVLGILALLLSPSIVLGFVLGLPALVVGILAARRARRGEAGGRGMAIAGAVLGALGILVAAGVLIAGLALFNSDSGKKLQDCLDKAGDDQAAAQQCQQQFADDLSG